MRIHFMSAAAFLALGLSACQRAEKTPPPVMKDYMVGVVAPAMQPAWDLAYADAITDADWNKLGRSIADLQAASAITEAGAFSDIHGRASEAPWKEWAGKMSVQTAALEKAVAAKDQEALANAGDAMLETCTGCHQAYPVQPTP